MSRATDASKRRFLNKHSYKHSRADHKDRLPALQDASIPRGPTARSQQRAGEVFSDKCFRCTALAFGYLPRRAEVDLQRDFPTNGGNAESDCCSFTAAVFCRICLGPRVNSELITCEVSLRPGVPSLC